MLKAHTYKTKQNYVNTTKKTNILKMELIISSNHEVSEYTLNNITDTFKKMNVIDYTINDDRVKIKGKNIVEF